MKKKIVSLLLVAVISITIQAKTVKIMPIGDSITDGSSSADFAGYRTALYKLFHDFGLDFQFVGARYTKDSNLPLEQRWHSAKGGFSIGPDNSWLGNSNSELVNYLDLDFDVIILMLGRNEYIGQTANSESPEIKYWNYVNRIYKSNPNAVIYMVSVPPMQGSDALTNPINLGDGAINGLNVFTPKIVNSFRNQGRKIYFIDIQPSISGLTFSDFPNDNVHPGVVGSAKIANVIYNAMKDNLMAISMDTALPAMPPIGDANTPPADKIYADYLDVADAPAIVAANFKVDFLEPNSRKPSPIPANWSQDQFPAMTIDNFAFYPWSGLESGVYGTAWLKIRTQDVTTNNILYPGHIYNGNYYLKFTADIKGSRTDDNGGGEVRLYLSYNDAHNNYPFEALDFTALSFMPNNGQISLVKRVNGACVFHKSVQLNKPLFNHTWTTQVYDENGKVSVFIKDETNNIIRLFDKVPIDIQTGEISICSSYVNLAPDSLIVKPISEAPAMPDLGVPVTEVSLNKASVNIAYIDESNLVATVFPAEAKNKLVSWKSSNPIVATVSDNGTISAKTIGQTTITVTTLDGNYSASCLVNVSEVESGDSPIPTPELSSVLYQNDFQDKNSESSLLWDLQVWGRIDGKLFIAPWQGAAGGTWSTLNKVFVGNFQTKYDVISNNADWHHAEIRLNVIDDNNYLRLYTTGGQGVKIDRVANGSSTTLVDAQNLPYRPFYTYTINQYGTTLEISRKIPEGRRKNLVYLTNITNTSGKIKFHNLDWWDSSSMDNLIITQFASSNPTGLSNLTNEKRIQIYPSTTTGIINIKGSEIETLSVLNINGMVIKSFVLPSNLIDISTLPSGFYLLKISTMQGITTEKVLLK